VFAESLGFLDVPENGRKKVTWQFHAPRFISHYSHALKSVVNRMETFGERKLWEMSKYW